MEKSIEEMVLIGYHHFSSKDKSQIFYVIQCLFNEQDMTKGTMKGTMINIFVNDETYKIVNQMGIGTPLKIEVSPNIQTGKLNYKVVI